MSSYQRLLRLLRTSLAALAILWAVASGRADANTYTVCPTGCPFPTIEAAVAAANPGDTITVGPGAYTETIMLRARVSLVGAGAGQVVVRGRTGQSVLKANSADIGPETLVAGFTLTAGNTVGGGGVYLAAGASPTLRNNRVVGNRAANGGGLYIDSASPRLEGNLIADNRSDQHGGGVVIIGTGATPTLIGNVIERNTAAYDGGGVVIQNGAAPYLEANRIQQNTALGMTPAAGIGGGVKIRNNSNPTLIDNRVEGNVAHTDGGGLYVETGSRPTLRHNVIAGNQAATFGGGLVIREAQPLLLDNLIVNNQSGSSPGVMIRRSQSVELINNTIADNGPTDSGVLLSDSQALLRNNLITGHGCGICMHGSSQAQLSHNDVWGNNLNYGGLPPGATDISVAPGLMPGIYGSHYLASDSPLRDRGEGTAASLGLDARSGIVDGFPDAGLVDIGFHYELPPHRYFVPMVTVPR